MLGTQLVPTPTRYATGGGRTASLEYPDPLQSDGNSVTAMSRGGVSKGLGSTSSGGGSRNVFTIKGVDCDVYQTLAAGDRIGVYLDALPIRIITTVGHGISKTNPLASYRVICNMATSGVVVDNAHDFGFSLCFPTGLAGSIFSDNLAGFGIVIRDAATFDFVIRGPNGLVRQQFTGLDTTNFHAYEFRIQCATDTDFARLSFLLDGVRQSIDALSSQWSVAGSNLQPNGTSGGRTGWTTRIMNACGVGGVGQLYVQGASVYAAPTEADCL